MCLNVLPSNYKTITLSITQILKYSHSILIKLVGQICVPSRYSQSFFLSTIGVNFKYYLLTFACSRPQLLIFLFLKQWCFDLNVTQLFYRVLITTFYQYLADLSLNQHPFIKNYIIYN